MPDNHLGLIVAVVAVIVLGLIFTMIWLIGTSDSQRRLDQVLDDLEEHLNAGHVTKSEYEQYRNIIERDALSP